jgi:hypothetical protein
MTVSVSVAESIYDYYARMALVEDVSVKEIIRRTLERSVRTTSGCAQLSTL